MEGGVPIHEASQVDPPGSCLVLFLGLGFGVCGGVRCSLLVIRLSIESEIGYPVKKSNGRCGTLLCPWPFFHADESRACIYGLRLRILNLKMFRFRAGGQWNDM